MASDLKIEIFSRYILSDALISLETMKTKTKIVSIFGEESSKVENCLEVCDIMFVVAVFCRRKMFGKLYLADFSSAEAKNLKSSYECYDYVTSTCDRDDLFGHLTVFERMLATSGFVIDFCTRIHEHNIVDVIKYAPMFWAMYFDKFTEEFYAEGGWSQLKEVAKSYSNVLGFYLNFDETEFHILGKAIEDYYDFMDSDQHCKFQENEIELKKTHLSKNWIKYKVELFENCTEAPSTYRYYVTFSEIEELLQNLKILCDYISKNPICDYDDLETLETSDEYDNYLKSLNAPEVGSFEEEHIEKSFEGNCSLKNGKQETSIDKRTDIISAKNEIKSELDGNSQNIPIQQCPENLYFRNIEQPSEMPCEPAVLSYNEMDVSLLHKKPLGHCIPGAINSSLEDGDNDEQVNTEESFEVNCGLKNGEQQGDIDKRAEIISAKNEIKSELDGKYQNIFIQARSYSNIIGFYSNFGDIEFHILGKAIEDYYDFMDSDQYYAYKENKVELKKNHVSEIWIKYKVEQFESCTKTPSTYRYYGTFSEIEELLQNWNFLYDCISNNPICVDDDVETLGTSDQNYNYLKSLNAPEVGSFEEEHIEKSFEGNCSLKNGKQHTSIEKRTEIISAKNEIKSELDGNSQNVSIQQSPENLYSRNIEQPSEMPCEPAGLSYNEMDVSLLHKKSFGHCILGAIYSINSSLEDEDNDEQVNTEKSFEVNCTLKNKDDQREIPETKEIKSGYQMSKSKLKFTCPTDILPEVLKPGNQYEFKNYEIDKRTEFIFVRNEIKSDLDGNSQNIPIQQCPEILHSKNIEKPSEMPCISGGLSNNEMDVSSLLQKKPLANSISEGINFSLEDGDSDEQVNTEKNFEVNCSLKIKDDRKEIPEAKKIKSAYQMSKSKLKVRCSTDILPEVLKPENRHKFTNYEIKKNKKARENLKKEQKEYDINIFLRMILVLNDRQVTKLVLQALKNNRDGPEKTQTTRKKKN